MVEKVEISRDEDTNVKCLCLKGYAYTKDEN